MSFKSSKIALVHDGELAVEGDLTIRDITRKVTFAVEGPTHPTKDPWGNTRWDLGDDEDQPQRFWTYLERDA